MSDLLRTEYVELEDVRLAYVVTGDAPEAVVLLHGWPQTSRCWRHVIPALADRYTVIAPDLRGYGKSVGKPNARFDKRSTAEDLGALIDHLGFERAHVAAHDRGARVAHRWAIDRPDQVSKLALLDILPTREVMRSFDLDSAKTLWHWLFHLQDEIPEILLKDRAEPYLRAFMGNAVRKGAIDEETFAHYVNAFEDPVQLHASLEDYRSSFGVDLSADELDFEQGKLLDVPLLILWGADGPLRSKPVLDVWRRYATSRVSGHSLTNCEHYLPEEQPSEVAAEVATFFMHR
ncbi:alpha/beta fold hydrolase [Rhodococcus opacus]|uniref:Alpha/beta hydrolase n=1 Tax=Rhodococcus opacus TaxID=37919 RepID=A0A2S8J734_RHOOP|nr:alpha/beta hydrolase [Rhodococcus opacus]PQP22838.1 alpha/beta hydrolase [Rhodococcus opacus]